MKRLLAEDGVALLHSMAQAERAAYNQPFMEKDIFPGGYIPSFAEAAPAVEAAGPLTRDVEIVSLHYAETTREWRRRFLERREEVLKLFDERFIRMWEFYLAGSEAAFRFDALHVFHLQMARRQERVPLTRNYIPEAQARLAEAELAIPGIRRAADNATRDARRLAQRDLLTPRPPGARVRSRNGPAR